MENQQSAEDVAELIKAAEKGDAQAQFNLGNRYALGKGVPQDDAEAVKWFTKSAEQDHALAQYHLGFCYNFGKSVAPNDAEVVRWYTKAAEQGLVDAQYTLGNYYKFGRKNGLPNHAEAIKWYTEAAKQGHHYSQHTLGEYYKSGEHVIRDLVKAEALFDLSKITKGSNLSGIFGVLAAKPVIREAIISELKRQAGLTQNSSGDAPPNLSLAR